MITRSYLLLRKSATPQLPPNIQRHEATHFRMKTLPSGGAVAGFTFNSNTEKGGLSSSVVGAEMDASGNIIKSGEMIYKKKIHEKSHVESRGEKDPREILKSLDLSIPFNLRKLGFEKTSGGISQENIDKLKYKYFFLSTSQNDIQTFHLVQFLRKGDFSHKSCLFLHRPSR